MSTPAELLGRYLRQQRELGEAEVILDRLAADELRDLLAERATPPAPPLVTPAERRVMTPREAEAGATAPGPTAPELVQLGSLDALREVALGCPRCRLSETRTRVVFGEGRPDADLLVVGEAPGADEDRSGRPFVGRAGKLLELLLGSIGFSRDAVYICNVLKCRPPANRNPQPDEVAACSPYLLRQVELVEPKVILACGTFAAQTLLATNVPIGRLRGQLHHYHGVPLVPTYHPAALLRNPGWIRPVWDDLQRLRTLVAPA